MASLNKEEIAAQNRKYLDEHRIMELYEALTKAAIKEKPRDLAVFLQDALKLLVAAENERKASGATAPYDELAPIRHMLPANYRPWVASHQVVLPRTDYDSTHKLNFK